MGDILRKVQRGQKLSISAAAYNAFVDAALDLRQRQTGISSTAQGVIQQPGIVLLRNDSGEDRVRFDVLGLESPIPTPAQNEAEFQNRVCLSGVVPEMLRHRGKFAILMEPIPTGAMGRGLVAGVGVAWIWIKDERHAYADVCDGDSWCLESMPYGPVRIVWKDSASVDDCRWAVVLLGDRGVPEVGIFGESGLESGFAEVLLFPAAGATEITPGVVRLDI